MAEKQLKIKLGVVKRSEKLETSISRSSSHPLSLLSPLALPLIVLSAVSLPYSVVGARTPSVPSGRFGLGFPDVGGSHKRLGHSQALGSPGSCWLSTDRTHKGLGAGLSWLEGLRGGGVEAAGSPSKLKIKMNVVMRLDEAPTFSALFTFHISLSFHSFC